MEQADKILVKLSDGKEFEARIIGKDAKTDIALIKIKPTVSLPMIEIGDSDKLRVGEWVLAIGNPFGLEQTVTAGIVSAKGRVIGAGPYDNFIQTDASINPGNSGGPLFNMEGKVIGINTAIVAQGQGIGFAIPVNMARNILPDLKTKGKVSRGWLGVSVQDITEDIAKSMKQKDRQGALVAEVFKGDPASNAGIKPGDIITEINGKKYQLARTAADDCHLSRGGSHQYQIAAGQPPHERECSRCGANRPRRVRARKPPGMITAWWCTTSRLRSHNIWD